MRKFFYNVNIFQVEILGILESFNYFDAEIFVNLATKCLVRVDQVQQQLVVEILIRENINNFLVFNALKMSDLVKFYVFHEEEIFDKPLLTVWTR